MFNDEEVYQTTPKLFVVVVQLLSRVQLSVTPKIKAHQASLSITISTSVLKLMTTESVMPSNYLILCHHLILLPSIFHSIRIFSNESPIPIRWSKCWSFSCSIIPSNECSRLTYFGLTDLMSLLSKGLSRVFSNTTVQKCQFFGTQIPFWCKSHIHTWLLEKP